MFFILHLGAQEFKFIDANISKEDEGIYALVEKYVDLNNQIKEFKKTMMKIQALIDVIRYKKTKRLF